MDVIKRFTLLCGITFFNFTHAQTGPGGVGSNDGNSNLIMWYRPDSGISTTSSSIDSWTNAAGISDFDLLESGTQRPTLLSGTLNGLNEVHFNGNNRLRTGLTLSSSNFIINEASTFVVAKADNITQQSSVYTTDPLENSSRFSAQIPWNGNVIYDLGACCSTDARIEIAGLYRFTNYSIWAYNAHPSSGKQLYRNATLIGDENNTTNYTSQASQRFNLGGNTTNTNGFSGNMAEIIIFKSKINDSQRIIIDNYLAAKYNLALDSYDLYTQDDPANGNFDYHVAGIGQFGNFDNHTDSQGTGIVRMHNPSKISKGDFLFWGEDFESPSYNFITNTINYTEQLNSKWRVNRSKNIGSVTISFDISSIDLSGLQNCSALQLVIDNNGDFSSPEKIYDLTISGHTATATKVDFKNDDYFTLRYVDQIVWDGTVFHNGSGPSNAPDTRDSCYKFTVKSGANSADLYFNAHVRAIEIESEAILNVISGILIETEDNVTINGTFNLLGEAQLIQNHRNISSNSGTGYLSIKQQGTSNLYNYNYWSAPVNRNGFWKIAYLEDNSGVITFKGGYDADPTTSPISLSKYWLYTFNGTSGNYYSWKKVYPNTNISPGLGYTMKGSGSVTNEQEYVFKGIPNDGEYNFNVSSGNGILLGNPYPSALDADQFILENLSVIDGTLSFWDQFETNSSHILAQYQAGYAKYNLMMAIPATALSGLISSKGTTSKPLPTNYIDVGQAFFVNVNNSGVLNFNNGQRAFAKETLNETVFYKTSSKSKAAVITDERPKIWFSFGLPQGYTKFIGLGYDIRATYGYDKGFDTETSISQDNLLWQTEDKTLSIQALPELNKDDVLPLSIKIKTNGAYTFSIYKMEHIPDDLNIFLVDHVENTYYNLRENDVDLILNSGTPADRFSIAFKEDTTLSTYQFSEKKIYATYDKNTESLKLHNLPADASALNIYNAVGQLITTARRDSSNIISLSEINDGVYFLNALSKTQNLKTIKFIKY
ncbi:T9SS type A sorting domain-containing protein [Aestuariibaculum suncheonense]|uniref:T9SS type A sorting domain-containing protein n=1 Tax=Aestuariibaculum suncheonense TaxID=1028745 RepID=A0A8J6QMZ8_9FLAO|nr:T9SS type A sorting domain-containing protein [Aestuariibaculum suncheonense]MBD0836946.1 T9SS type A sorting domain-containing protein [Aestuariibaculum suncheonense]